MHARWEKRIRPWLITAAVLLTATTLAAQGRRFGGASPADLGGARSYFSICSRIVCSGPPRSKSTVVTSGASGVQHDPFLWPCRSQVHDAGVGGLDEPDQVIGPTVHRLEAPAPVIVPVVSLTVNSSTGRTGGGLGAK